MMSDPYSSKSGFVYRSRLHYNLATVALHDVAMVMKKDVAYGSSWKLRGGVGAFMMLARKWDRIETQVKSQGYDIFAACQKAEGVFSEDLLDTIADLRAYLLLVEQEVRGSNGLEMLEEPAETALPFASPDPHPVDPHPVDPVGSRFRSLSKSNKAMFGFIPEEDIA